MRLLMLLPLGVTVPIQLNACWCSLITLPITLVTIVPARPLAPTESSRRWATLLQQIFEVDPLACPSCHGAMRIVACITQTSVIDQILTHLRTHASREAHAPPVT